MMKTTKSQIVTATALGAHLDLTRQRVTQLVNENIISRRADGRFDLNQSRVSYIRWLRGTERRSVRAEADVQYRKLRARGVELRIAELEGRLIEITDMEEVVDEFAGIIRSELAGLPARVTRDLILRRTIEQAIDDILYRVADSIRQARDCLQPPAGADGIVAASDP